MADENSEKRPRSMMRIRGWWRVLIVTAIVLLWPLYFRGAPFYFDDAASYVKGGIEIFETFGEWFGIEPVDDAEPANDELIIDLPEEEAGPGDSGGIVGMRSAAYSAVVYMTYLLSSNLAWLAVLQALMIAYAIATFIYASLRRTSAASSIFIIISLAILTGAPFYTSYATPDIFAAGTILGIVLLSVYGERLSNLDRVLMGLFVTFILMMHARNVMIVLPMVGWVLVETVIRYFRRDTTFNSKYAMWVAGPVVLCLVILTSVAYFGLGELNPFPKRYPYILARAVEDGPALWHLEDHGEEYNYTVWWVIPEEIPDRVGLFLWGPGGVERNATPEQMDEIRAEELTIVWRAFKEYPLEQLEASFRNIVRQMTEFGVVGIETGEALSTDEDGYPMVVGWTPMDMRLLEVTEQLQYDVVLLCIPLILFLIAIGRVAPIHRRAFRLILFALAGNTIISAVISSPAHRYLGSVIWILPLFASILLLESFMDKTEDESLKENGVIAH